MTSQLEGCLQMCIPLVMSHYICCCFLRCCCYAIFTKDMPFYFAKKYFSVIHDRGSVGASSNPLQRIMLNNLNGGNIRRLPFCRFYKQFLLNWFLINLICFEIKKKFIKAKKVEMDEGNDFGCLWGEKQNIFSRKWSKKYSD